VEPSHDPTSDPLARASPGVGPLPSDWLSDVLETVRLSGAVFFLWEAHWPFTMPVADGADVAGLVLPGAQTLVSFHAVLEGSCFAATEDVGPVALSAGDVLLVPQGRAYAMSDRADACRGPHDVRPSHHFFAAMAKGALPDVIREGSGPRRTDVVCGFLGCDLWPFNPVLAALPSLVRVPAVRAAAVHPWLTHAASASRSPRPGGRQALHRLSEWLFVELLRCSIDEVAPAGSWLRALRSAGVGRALRLLHADPGHPWTLEELATRSGISRSRLAETFAATVGLPPMQYLARWRIQRAARALVETDAKVEAIARDVGYRSAAAFSRAFKRWVGRSPAAWRGR